ncbi:uncharacterized protein N7469_005264 [Penicillium citrinum]|uniref:Uncharacterized protein n=1 Tax=Penicillium citrinum TaxID=5077 RepID=A0A9W9TPH4_PENCI|nr:uncharacterized protein N7469_005264 [Penicillium citrinum]KAJ5233498.1 hypothetical protein N7469_005264 [Penicillium citrinum]
MTISKGIDTSEFGLGKQIVDGFIKYVNSLGIADEKDNYSGATAKSDAREITLVRKLDMRIIPVISSPVR